MEYKITNVPINEIKPYPKNPRKNKNAIKSVVNPGCSH
jgi:hypothetical protein